MKRALYALMILTIGVLACQAAPTVRIEATCSAEGFTEATDGTYLLYQDEELDATIEYKNGVVTIYDEPSHEVFESHLVSVHSSSLALLQRFNEQGYLIKEIDILACYGNLLIRERIIDPPQPPAPLRQET